MDSTQENNFSKQNTADKEPVTNCDRLTLPIENRILTLRGKQVMVDRDLAELYEIETKRLNEQVRRMGYIYNGYKYGNIGNGVHI